MASPRGENVNDHTDDVVDRQNEENDEEDSAKEENSGRNVFCEADDMADASDGEHVGATEVLNKEVLDDLIDEGCILEMDEAKTPLRSLGPINEDSLPRPTKLRCPADDSGVCSRMSEASSSTRRGPPAPSDIKKAVAEVGHSDDSRDDFVVEIESVNDGKCRCGLKTVLIGIVKLAAVLLLLYLFICSLDLLSNAFRLVGGKTAGSVFQDNALLQNPITGLMIGVMATVILQSSSTSTSIVITMVSSGIIEVRPSIPIIMGANIGTTVTNTLVSLAHAVDPNEFRRAFSGATVHDVFNWLTVLVLLPLEHFTGYLYHLTGAIVENMKMEHTDVGNQDMLKKLTKPLTKAIVQIDENVINNIAEGKASADARLLKTYCKFRKEESWNIVNKTDENGTVFFSNETIINKIGTEECSALLSKFGLSDMASGLILLFFSLLMLSTCLYLLVKVLHSLLGSQVAKMAKKTINANFPGRFACFTDYFALLVGAGMTVLVQSSSVFTSALTPLVGVGCLKLERMYPLTLGSNIGTTGTGILAAMAASSATMKLALQLAFCHLFFNITGILLFFPIPFMRRIPLRAARFLGHTTARYRWFAVFYLLMMFLIFPGFFLALSFAGNIVFLMVIGIVSTLALAVVVINVLHNSRFRTRLPLKLQTWDWLPEPMRSLRPLDRMFLACFAPLQRVCCQCCVSRCQCLFVGADETEFSDDEDEEDSDCDESSASCFCCCGEDRRGLQRVEQVEPSYIVAQQPKSAASGIWKQRASPIYKPSHKHKSKPVHKSSTVTVPLISIPESVV